MLLREEKKQNICAKFATALERDHLEIFEQEANHHHHVVPKQARSISRSSAISSTMDRALALKANLEEGKPYFIKAMLKSHVTDGYWLCAAEDIRQHFQACGTVNWVTILTDTYCQPKGCAFLEFVEVEAVQIALLLTGSELRGRKLKVAAKRTNMPGMPQPRGSRPNPWFGSRRPSPPHDGYGWFGSKKEDSIEACKGHLVMKFIKECWQKCCCPVLLDAD